MTPSSLSRGYSQDISADLDTCWERGNPNSCDILDPVNGSNCEFASAQYFRKVVLGIDKALVQPIIELDENGTEVTKMFALTEPWNIGEIKWDITLCLLLSWTVVCACLIKGQYRNKSSHKQTYFKCLKVLCFLK